MLVKSQSMNVGTPFSGTATSSRFSGGTQKEVSFISSGLNTSSRNKSSTGTTSLFSWFEEEDCVVGCPSREAASATAQPSRLKPVLLYNGRVQGSNARGLVAMARIISSLLHSIVPLDRSLLPGSQNAGALISTSSRSWKSGNCRTSLVKTTVNHPLWV